MRIISTRVHSILDYLLGILLIIAPWLFVFDDNAQAAGISIMLGIVLILMSALTDYEMGLARLIPLSVHRTLDVACGALLAVSPWAFGFSDRVILPHLLIGLAQIAISALTHAPATPQQQVPSS